MPSLLRIPWISRGWTLAVVFLFLVFFAIQKLLSLIRSHLFICFLNFYYSRRRIEEDIAAIYVKECSTCLFL